MDDDKKESTLNWLLEFPVDGQVEMSTVGGLPRFYAEASGLDLKFIANTREAWEQGLAEEGFQNLCQTSNIPFEYVGKEPLSAPPSP